MKTELNWNAQYSSVLITVSTLNSGRSQCDLICWFGVVVIAIRDVMTSDFGVMIIARGKITVYDFHDYWHCFIFYKDTHTLIRITLKNKYVSLFLLSFPSNLYKLILCSQTNIRVVYKPLGCKLFLSSQTLSPHLKTSLDSLKLMLMHSYVELSN